MNRFLPCFVLLIGVASAETIAPLDPFLGVWTLDVKLSKYPPKACPQRMTIEMSATPEGVHYHSNTLYANGRTAVADYTAAYDNKPTIVAGSPGLMLPVALKRENPRTVQATYWRGFRVMATSRRVVSADGRRMVITTKSENADGKVISNVGVYTKMSSAAART